MPHDDTSTRQDLAKSATDLETRNWYDFHLPTGILLNPYQKTIVKSSLKASSSSKPSSISSAGSGQLYRTHTRNASSNSLSKSVSMANFRQVHDLRRGDRIILPEDPEFKKLNKTGVPKGVLIVNRYGIQEDTGLAALQLRTFVHLQLYEVLIPDHVKAVHVVETETMLMERISPNLPFPGYFTLEHAYLTNLEKDYTPTPQEEKENTRTPLYNMELAFIGRNRSLTIEKFIACESVFEAINRLHVSWHVG